MPRSDRRVVPVLATAPPRRGFLSVLAALAFPAACGGDAAGPPVFPPPDGLPTPISCPGFTVVDTQITVGPNGGIQPIGGGHRLEFAPNAVSGLSNYYVRRGPTAGRAEIDIVPQGAADTEFGADVFLELSYAGCPDLANDTLVIVMTHPAQKSLGGRNDRQRRVVRALIPHLTMFAIAR